MAETIIGRHQEQHFWKSICAFLFMFFFCACHLNAQEVVTMQQLEGTKWQMKEPNNNKNEVGQSTKGTYILQELNGGIFWFQICEYTSTKLVLKNKLGQTLTFKKQ